MSNVAQLCLAVSNILLMHKWKLFSSCNHSCMKMVDCFASRRYSLKKTISVIEWYLAIDSANTIIILWSVSVSKIINFICQSWRLKQIIDLLATDKSWYFAQPWPIIVNYFIKRQLSVQVMDCCTLWLIHKYLLQIHAFLL